MKDKIAKLITNILVEMGIPDVVSEVEVPEDASHGDYTTNVAMRIATSSKFKVQSSKWKSPMEFALSVKERIQNLKLRIKNEGGDHNIYQKDQKVSRKESLNQILQAIDRVEVAPPGFINFFLTEASLINQIDEVLKEKETFGTSKTRDSGFENRESKNELQKSESVSRNSKLETRNSKKIMVEFAHPNTHKAFHIGHLRNITTGESIIRLLESQGYEVIRANYQGDVGMHIAKALYALLRLSPYKDDVMKHLEGDRQAKARHGSFQVSQEKARDRVDFLGKAYAAGSKTFEDDPKAVEEIKDINYLIYAAVQRFNKERGIKPSSTDYMQFVKGRSVEVDRVYELWKETRGWSLDYFENIYKRVGSHYDRLYFESECLEGVDLAKEAVKGGVLKESDGAIIFDGKPYGLDTRVFVNSLGLPTYEGKELALSTKEMSEFGKLDRLIHVVGPEQASFFKTTFKAEELLGIVGPNVQHHLIYGWVKLKHGKMSSRSGNVVLGEWLLDEAKKSIYKILERSESESSDSALHPPGERRSHLEGGEKGGEKNKEEIAEKAAVAAVKYAFLKVGTTSEIAFDLKESVNFQGDSGPYLQYTYARARSVLRKAQSSKLKAQIDWSLVIGHWSLNVEERSLARLILYFPDVVAAAAESFSPNTLCTYLFELAQAFNLFYAKHSILGGSEVQSVKGKVKNKKQDARDSTTEHSSLSTPDSSFRLAMTSAVAQVLKNGLFLLSIETLEHM